MANSSAIQGNWHSSILEEEIPIQVKKQPWIRVQNNILARPERAILNWLCSRMPNAVTSDPLTAVRVAGAVIVLAGYIGSRFDPALFWLATVGFLVNWFGYSLVESPRYGYFLDHSADAVSILLILVGLGFSAYLRLDVALSVLVSYFLMCIYVFLYNHVSGTFRISFAALGPTELRIGLIIMNLWMFVSGPSKFAILGQTFSVYDLVFSLVAVTLVCLFVVSMLQAVRRLRREDCPAVLSKTRTNHYPQRNPPRSTPTQPILA